MIPHFKKLAIVLLTLAGCAQTPYEQTELDSTSSMPSPTNLKGSATSTEISLSWENPEYDGDYFLRVQHRKAGEEYQIDATLEGQDSYKITNLETSKTYEIRVQAISKDGEESSYSDSLSIATILRKGYIGDKEIVLPNIEGLATIYSNYNSTKTTWSWSDPDLTGIESYDVYRKRNSDVDWSFLSNQTSIAANPSFIDNNPDALTVAYRITVNYKDDANTVANFDSDFANYSLPGITGLTAVYNNYNSATINWNWSSTDLSSIGSYEIYKQKYNDGIWTLVSNVTTIAKTFTDSNVQATTVKYRVRVHYKDSSDTVRDFDMGSSINFNLPSANTLSASYNSYNSVSFTWKWSSVDTSSIASYDIYRQIRNNGTWTKVNATAITTIGTSYTDTNPAATIVKYRLAVKYKDDRATLTNYDMATSVSYALPQTGTPTVKIVNNGQVQVSWTWTNTNHYDVLSSFKIQRSIDMVTPSWSTLATILTVNPPASSYIDTPPATDDAYVYRVEVVYKSGAPLYDSPKSSAIQIPFSLSPPTNFSVTSFGIDTANTMWSYMLNATNVDSFTIETTAKTISGITLDTSSFTTDYSGTRSSYALKIMMTAAGCDIAGADVIDFKIRAEPSDISKNSSSIWVNGGSLQCNSCARIIDGVVNTEVPPC